MLKYDTKLKHLKKKKTLIPSIEICEQKGAPLPPPTHPPPAPYPQTSDNFSWCYLISDYSTNPHDPSHKCPPAHHKFSTENSIWGFGAPPPPPPPPPFPLVVGGGGGGGTFSTACKSLMGAQCKACDCLHSFLFFSFSHSLCWIWLIELLLLLLL
jgi:hypothetical protein